MKKYFASIDHEILKQHIRWRIADADMLWLVDLIIDNSNEQEFVYDLFPGDDLFTPLERRKGLPLGNLTSRFFANLYLNQFDHFIKEKLPAKCYIRYVDDFLIASNSKDFLHDALRQCEQYLVGLRLKLHPRKCHILQSDRGVPFLGQVIYPDYRLLKKNNVQRFTKRLKKRYTKLQDGRITRKEFEAGINGWRGHAMQADTWRLRKELEKKFASFEIQLTEEPGQNI
ncbi:MAG: hypothetical protein GWP06_05035 [Actinobacteria bacterium]|nr:hypothetical protein [Actinomycetota bacterium]